MKLRISSAERHYKCPGAANAETARKESGQPERASGPDALAGVETHMAIHDVLAGRPIPDGLDSWQEQVCKWAVDEVKKYEPDVEPDKLIVEQEIYINSVYGKILWTGHPDRAAYYQNEGVLHLWDYKTGRGTQIQAARNIQLRGYAVALTQFLEISSNTIIRAHLLSAGEDGEDERHTSVEFRNADIADAFRDMFEIWERSQAKDAVRTPDLKEHCKYCLACGTEFCPESLAALDGSVLPIKQNVGELAPRDMVRYWVNWHKAIKPAGEALDRHIKALLKADENALPGLGLGTQTSVREITDLNALFSEAQKLGMSSETFVGCCKLTLKAFHDAVRITAKGEDKPLTHKEADALVNRMLALADCFRYKPKARPVVIKED